MRSGPMPTSRSRLPVRRSLLSPHIRRERGIEQQALSIDALHHEPGVKLRTEWIGFLEPPSLSLPIRALVPKPPNLTR